MVGHRHAPDQLLQLEDLPRAEHPLELGLVRRGGGRDDLLLLLGARVVDQDVEHEAVELGLGQRIGAFQLDRILGREHEERQRQRVGLAAGGDFLLLHRLEQGRLGLGRRAVDLVGQHDVGEHRTVDEAHHALPGRLVLLEDVGAGDVARHQVGRELDAAELEVEHAGETRDQQGLGQPGHADQQHVAVGEQRGQELFDHGILADDDLAQLGLDALTRRANLFDGLEIGGGVDGHEILGRRG